MMSRARTGLSSVGAMVVIGLSVTGCGAAGPAEKEFASAAHVEKSKDGQPTVVLSKDAARRIDVQTAPVEAVNGASQIPYGAVLYDPAGKAWAFVDEKNLRFRRAPLVIKAIQGTSVVLAQGPAAGTNVVTVGAPELYGAELGVGDNE